MEPSQPIMECRLSGSVELRPACPASACRRWWAGSRESRKVGGRGCWRWSIVVVLPLQELRLSFVVRGLGAELLGFAIECAHQRWRASVCGVRFKRAPARATRASASIRSSISRSFQKSSLAMFEFIEESRKHAYQRRSPRPRRRRPRRTGSATARPLQAAGPRLSSCARTTSPCACSHRLSDLRTVYRRMAELDRSRFLAQQRHQYEQCAGGCLHGALVETRCRGVAGSADDCRQRVVETRRLPE